MAIAANGERQLVELKAVDAAYPLSRHRRHHHGPPPTSPRRDGIVADPLVLDRLGVKPGAPIRLGQGTFTLRAALTSEPDRVAGPAILGPRVMIAMAALPATGLVQPGSLLAYDLRVASSRPAPTRPPPPTPSAPPSQHRLAHPRHQPTPPPVSAASSTRPASSSPSSA